MRPLRKQKWGLSKQIMKSHRSSHLGLGVVSKQAATRRTKSKLQAKFVGPYKVITACSDYTYVVKSLNSKPQLTTSLG